MHMTYMHVQMVLLCLVSVARSPSAPPASLTQTLFITELDDPNGVHAARICRSVTQQRRPIVLSRSVAHTVNQCYRVALVKCVLTGWTPFGLNHDPRVGLGSLRVGHMARDVK
jgi:hypothetical protein